MRWIFTLPLLLAACGDPLPDLQSRLSPTAQTAAFPELVPLGPLLAEADAVPPRTAEEEGQSLDARSEDLRRRANALRRLQLP
ncbi:hypothetical protein QTA57_10245 [Fontisubflavum oceani]|uniref:hypothetical protein n=1 Tax=Fontisubflavum oceani TaxID=2978973 RepID=UPI0025B54B39|nr:hypothetical protein [Fontisubflavum oceani]WJY20264.1 hypothetical protein QTA57_10245 [Fontisubflavum oceani]